MSLNEQVKQQFDKEMAEIQKLEGQLSEKKKAVEPMRAYLISAGMIPAPEKKKRASRKKMEASKGQG